jgi:Arc/MetJ-type ribon-helix-helix transcriptional regulator
MPVISFRVPREVYEKLREKAEAGGLTVSDYVRRLVLKDVDVPSTGVYAGTSTGVYASVDEVKKVILGELDGRLRHIEGEIALLREKIERLEKSQARGSGAETTTSETESKPRESRCPSERVHVKPLDEVRNAEGYVKWLRERCGYDEVNEDASVTHKGRRVRAIVATSREYIEEAVRTLNERGSKPDQLAGYHKILYEAGFIYYDAKKGWVTVG